MNVIMLAPTKHSFAFRKGAVEQKTEGQLLRTAQGLLRQPAWMIETLL